ncbi:MAG: DDE-type integrase/transposase/recombinase [Cyanobacteria bacterium P01_D01_bin.115]
MVINVDKNAAYPAVVDDLKAKKSLHEASELRPVKYLNNTIEQDHRRIKRVVKLGLSFGSFHTARHILKGYEAMAMIRKGQIQNVDRDDVIGRLSFIHLIFGITA